MIRQLKVVEELKKKAIEEKAKEQLKEVVIPESNEIKEEIMTSNLVAEETQLDNSVAEQEVSEQGVVEQETVLTTSEVAVSQREASSLGQALGLKEMGFLLKKDGSVEKFNAEIFVEYFLSKNKVAYDADKKYYFHNGNFWGNVSQIDINRKMKESIDTVARYYWNPNYEKSIMSFMELSDIYVEKMNHNFNVIPFKDFNIDFSKGEIVEKKINDYFTYAKGITKEEYEKTETPVFDAFIEDITQGDEDFKRYLLQMMGILLSGQNRLHKVFIVYGVGKNSKSVFLKLIEHMIGRSFVESRKMSGFGNNFTLGGLEDKKLVTCGEIDTTKPLNVEVVKSISGGDSIQLEQKFKQIKSCELALNFIFSTNILFKIIGDNVGVRRRFQVIHFPYQIPEEKVDINLLIKLKAEEAGIFRKVLCAYRQMLIKDGDTVTGIDFKMSENVERFTNDYFGKYLVNPSRASHNSLECEEFFETYFEEGEDSNQMYKSSIYEFYKSRGGVLTRSQFWKISRPILDDMGAIEAKNRERFYKGIKLKEEYDTDTQINISRRVVNIDNNEKINFVEAV